ncbi:calcium-binding protein [Massilia sp. DJPM01]|uniref:calcium-binding protein n=1 Tax=Massilia sp. DJPM01 TaxID=3024404 RepID=UPI00259F6590|nr:calcium-binding protein [Massilia sp. DJPM01]MDM5176141.1 calcium-binding protein [Massilia sp. DJPM01]
MHNNTFDSISSAISTAYVGTAGNDTLTGGDTDDVLQGQAGADKLFGMGGNDTLDGGAGNDTMDGGLGSDVYLFGRGDGRDIVYGTGVRPAGETNTLRFKPGVLPADIGFDMSGTSLLININGSTDQFRVDGFLYGNSITNTANPLQQIVFANGITWDLAAISAALYAGTDLADTRSGTYLDDRISGRAGDDALSGKTGNDVLDGGSGNDSLSGEGGNDTLDGGTGNDRLYGGDGNDTYSFGKGDGQDTIVTDLDRKTGSVDTLSFKAGVLPSDIELTANGGMLIIKIKGSTDQLRADGYVPLMVANTYTNPLQQFLFADGSSWNLAAINAKLYAGTSGNDVLTGTGGNDRIYGQEGNDWLDGGFGNDTLDGGPGSDEIQGGFGDDTYVYGPGDGLDSLDFIRSTEDNGFNTLQFKAGILPDDVHLESTSSVLLIRFLNAEGQIQVSGFLANGTTSNPVNTLQRISFADGTSWDLPAIEAKLFKGTEVSDTIGGSNAGDNITGRGGNDTLDGADGNDTLEGGKGMDELHGGSGNDTYVFGRGDGQDAIKAVEANARPDTVDTLQFKAGIAGSDLQLSADGHALLIKIAGSADQIRVDSFILQEVPRWFNSLQKISFADGVTWDLARIKAELLADTTPVPASAAWLETPFSEADVALIGNTMPLV